MPRHTHTAVIALAAAGLGILGTYAWFAYRVTPGPVPMPGAGAPAAKPGSPPGGPPGGFAIAVEAVEVRPAPVQDSLTAVGTVRSNESVVLRPEIAGRIAAINFKDGAPVEKGAVLVALDASTQEAELAQAQANLALAQANFKRTEDLFRKAFVSERAKDESAANLRVLEAAAQLAEARLRKTQLRAPFTGIVGIRNVSVGDYVKEGADLINLEDLRTVKVDFRLPEAYLTRLRTGQAIDISTDALPGERFEGVVDAVDPQIDQTGRAVQVRARLANPKARLKPGMFARVRLAFGETREALAVPEEAVVPFGGDAYVFKVADGKAQRVRIQTGSRRAGRVEIAEGLAAGDVVVTAGQLKLRDGVPVKVVPPGGAPAQAQAGAAAGAGAEKPPAGQPPARQAN